MFQKYREIMGVCHMTKLASRDYHAAPVLQHGFLQWKLEESGMDIEWFAGLLFQPRPA